MSLRDAFRRIGAASPLVPALGYGLCVLVSALLVAADPDSLLLAVLSLLLSVSALLALFVIITWFRDDDWLAAGFLFGITTMLAGAAAGVVVGILQTGSLGGAIVTSAGMLMAVVFRALIAVPIAGGVIALARFVTRKVKTGYAHQPGPLLAEPAADATTHPGSSEGRSTA